jgi:pimeloyl-ACP methyl ester carboxylesterase
MVIRADPAGGIFISYRRQETSHLAGRLYDRLADHFGEDQVFMDVDTIDPGVDFTEAITRAVGTCQVLLAVIGPQWLTAADKEGYRRLDSPDDIVRLEVGAALQRDVRVIPILVEGAVMPRRQELPDSLAGLARRNALAVRHDSFRYDVQRLVTVIEGVLRATTPSMGMADVQAETRYVWLGQNRVAYQVLGQGQHDLVITPGSFTHVDTMWEDPAAALMFRRLASFARLIRFDRLGTGASDPAPLDHLPPWESSAKELAAVLDEVGSERAAILASLDAGSMAMYFAATKPERTSALILFNTTAKYLAADDYPIGVPREVAEAFLDQVDQLWGTEAMAQLTVPSRADDARFRRWIARAARSAASPRAAQAFLRVMFQIDARPLLPLIHAPTLVLHRTGYPILPIGHARFLAEQIPDAKLIELPGSDALLPYQDADIVLDHIEAFLGQLRRPPAPARVLASVLFTEIVGSTDPPGLLGDWRSRQLLDLHDELARRTVEKFQGQLIKTSDDGILATFDGPGRGIRCAVALRDELRGIGLQIRAGLHIGEVELQDGGVGGMAVDLAARVMTAAGSGEVFISRTVGDLIVGSNITVDDRGSHALKGIEGSWQLFAVTRA